MQEDQTGKDIYTSKLDIVSNSQDLVEFKNIVSDILKNNVIVDLNYF